MDEGWSQNLVIKIHIYFFRKWLKLQWCVRDRWMEGDKISLHWTITSSLYRSKLCYLQDLTFSVSRPRLLIRRPSVGHSAQWGTICDCKLTISQELAESNSNRYQHILFHNAGNIRLDHMIFFFLFTLVRLWLLSQG